MYSGQKYVPSQVKQLETNQLRLFFDWCMLGDGYSGFGNVEYYSKSNQFADDMQEIALKLGYNASIRKKKKGKYRW